MNIQVIYIKDPYWYKYFKEKTYTRYFINIPENIGLKLIIFQKYLSKKPATDEKLQKLFHELDSLQQVAQYVEKFYKIDNNILKKYYQNIILAFSYHQKKIL